MNKCIICGDDSGFGMICDGCKEAIQHYKKLYLFLKDLRDRGVPLSHECKKMLEPETEK